MKCSYIFAAVAVFGLMAACGGSPPKKADKADAKMMEKRMKLVDEYRECTEKAAAEDQVKMEQCDQIMKMIEALK